MGQDGSVETKDAAWDARELEEVVHPAVELLLKRLASHPDEFTVGGWKNNHTGNYRWKSMVEFYLPYFSRSERESLTAAVAQAQMDLMHRQVMAMLLEGPPADEANDPNILKTPIGHPSAYPSGTVGSGQWAVGKFTNTGYPNQQLGNQAQNLNAQQHNLNAQQHNLNAQQQQQKS